MTVNHQTLDEAIAEAERFLKRAKELKREQADYEKRKAAWEKEHGRTWYGTEPMGGVYGGSQYTSAVKRSSMDLSRALSALRRRA